MGGIIYVCGLFGAGKTTLIQATLGEIKSLNHLVTYVTRPPRLSEQTKKQGEYQFVSYEEYEYLRQVSTDWDHTEIGGFFYGADAAAINRRLAEGQDFIVAATSDLKKLKEMQMRYAGQRSLIWIDADLETCNQRVLSRDGEAAAEKKRNDPTQTFACADQVRRVADHIFTPTGLLEEDTKNIVLLIQKILKSW
jgi:guanylate kinase